MLHHFISRSSKDPYPAGCGQTPVGVLSTPSPPGRQRWDLPLSETGVWPSSGPAPFIITHHLTDSTGPWGWSHLRQGSGGENKDVLCTCMPSPLLGTFHTCGHLYGRWKLRLREFGKPARQQQVGSCSCLSAMREVPGKAEILPVQGLHRFPGAEALGVLPSPQQDLPEQRLRGKTHRMGRGRGEEGLPGKSGMWSKMGRLNYLIIHFQGTTEVLALFQMTGMWSWSSFISFIEWCFLGNTAGLLSGCP